jgi:hypothetical protein
LITNSLTPFPFAFARLNALQAAVSHSHIDISFVADWRKIGERRQSLTNHGNQRKNAKYIDDNYKVGDKVLVINKGILRKAEAAYGKEPWTITTVHTNGTIRIQCGTKTEQLSIWRVEPFTDDIL